MLGVAGENPRPPALSDNPAHVFTRHKIHHHISILANFVKFAIFVNFARVSEHATADAKSGISVPVSLFSERNALCCYVRHYLATKETARKADVFCYVISA